MTQHIVFFDKVKKKYKTDIGKKSTEALRSVSFKVHKGETFGIIGPNGAGKSTALKILLGFVRPDKGQVLLNNLHPSNPKSHNTTGYLPEHPCLYKHLSIYEHLKFAARMHSQPKVGLEKRILAILERVNLLNSVNVPIRHFSKGMTQRGALAFALINEPEVLILDEPMSGLDPVGRQLVLDIIKEYKKNGTTILFCSHILTDVERICDRISIMHEGKLAATITPQELQDTNRANKIPIQSPLESFFFQTIKPEAQQP